MLGALAIICTTIVLLLLISWGIMYATLNKCKHKYNPPENGIQKCINCGVIRYDECNHSWKSIDAITIGPTMVNTIQCKNCGEIVYRTFNSLKGE